ncbi:MAG: hypothetical protein JW744_04525 [Candidatus Diapherotrites archaeon]|uniref:Terpene cyclase/mutase family protein n=1 Tax=Candidatus Iainarchaeum sp. TaxID=3101447 RepID=A0A938YTA5_9ARCH|nr:hypothetical protein [Candidatus Diapherotrites archaeon]
MELKERIALAQNWLLHSGIQAKSGAFNSWLDLDSETYPFAYSEITGYALTTLVFLNGEGKGSHIESASSAAKWLEEEAVTKEGAVKARQYHDANQADKRFSFKEGNIFSFDCGMVMKGFLSFYNQTGKKSYLAAAKRIASFLDEKMGRKGEMHAVYNLNSRKFLDSSSKWSWQPGAYHAKNAIAYIQLSEATGDKSLLETAKNLCESALKMQEPSGRFVTSAKDKSTHLHPHCYAAEGLLYAGTKLGEKRFVEAAKKAAEWAISNQAKNGGINPFFDGSWNSNQRSDVIAQVLRLYSALNSTGNIEKKYSANAKLLEERLVSFQNLQEGQQQGGFFYGKELDGNPRNSLNSWCTMFALQALSWFENLAGGKALNMELLI